MHFEMTMKARGPETNVRGILPHKSSVHCAYMWHLQYGSTKYPWKQTHFFAGAKGQGQTECSSFWRSLWLNTISMAACPITTCSCRPWITRLSISHTSSKSCKTQKCPKDAQIKVIPLCVDWLDHSITPFKCVWVRVGREILLPKEDHLWGAKIQPCHKGIFPWQ
jgi:hypothetical protein